MTLVMYLHITSRPLENWYLKPLRSVKWNIWEKVCQISRIRNFEMKVILKYESAFPKNNEGGKVKISEVGWKRGKTTILDKICLDFFTF